MEPEKLLRPTPKRIALAFLLSLLFALATVLLHGESAKFYPHFDCNKPLWLPWDS